uniref:ATP-binding protein n=1 Tax=Ekhidna sp. TaxID=2608089 RepID=UPI0032ED6C6E
MPRLFLAILLVLAGSHLSANGDSWQKILKNKKGTVKFYWYPNNVIIGNSLDIIDGIEHDLALSFASYLESMYGVELELQWIETKSFEEVMELVRVGEGGTFGASSLSITPQRQQSFNFTEPYMADIAVLVSSADIPVALSEYQLSKVLEGKTAVSIRNTTLIEALNRLKDNLGVDFNIEYATNSGNILDQIDGKGNSFGYVDIANFLVAVDNNVNVKRQFFFPVKLEGLAMIFPKNSDWIKPVNDYFNSARFLEDRARIITKYLGENASEIINRISKSAEIGPLEEIVLSNREKEAQYERLLEAAQRDKDADKLSIILIAIIVVIAVVLMLVYALYRVKSKNTSQLLEQQRLVEETNNQLRNLNEEKNNLIQVLAHDLRAPLSTLSGGADMLKAKENLSEEGEKILGFMHQSSEKMQGLINKILDVDAIETGKHNLKIEEFDILEVIRQSVHENQQRADDKSIALEMDEASSLTVKADKVYTLQVIDNLISNAIKYSNESSRVVISTEPRSEMVQISVKDQGPGLSEDDKKRIFRKYQRLSARPTKGELSIGLGLSIVKLFTERMGGKVSFDTELRSGTTFHIQLPKA